MTQITQISTDKHLRKPVKSVLSVFLTCTLVLKIFNLVYEKDPCNNLHYIFTPCMQQP